MYTETQEDLTEENAEQQPLKNEANLNVQKLSFWQKIKYVKSNISVEPVLALFIMPSILAGLATQNLNLDKACRVNLQFDDSVCTDLSLRRRANHTFEEDEVQKLIASVQAWKGVISTLVPTLLILFIGAWSDKTGRRKICMTVPILGEFMTYMLNMVNTYFFYEVPVELTVFMEIMFPAITGGWATMLLGTYSYISDISSKETRTWRIGILSLCMTIGFPLGMGVSGVLLKYAGYYGVFSVSAMLQFLNFCYVIFVIKDHRWLEKEANNKTGCKRYFLEFFDFRNIKDTFQIAFKQGLNNRRLRICLIMIVACFNYGAFSGEMSIMYIFTRYHFNWDEVKYSIFSTYSLITHAMGTMFAISVFSKKLRLDDAILGMISTISKIVGSVALAFARNNTEIYMVSVLQILDGTTMIALRSIASKLVSHQELGKVFSLFGLVETMVSIMFAPLYSRVYILTLYILPGAVFLLSATCLIPGLGIFIWFYGRHKKDAREKRRDIASMPPK